ncbi:MAG TPA: winged helix-turn-helix domain-containing protein [Gaiellaceae bacterium]|nr:winged helix-turn-helix domain-containing protein [Gaiellaceae bacterium]
MSTTSATWVFLTNHANVLLCVASDPDARSRDIAERVGITERAAQRILSDLLAEGYLSKIKQGRRNRYTVNRTAHLRHPNFQEFEIGPLIDILRNGTESRPRAAVKHDGASPSR